MAVSYGALSLIFIPFLFIMSSVATHSPGPKPAGIMALGTGFIIILPVLYAAMGFVLGVICAGIYNLIAKWIGGIEVEVE